LPQIEVGFDSASPIDPASVEITLDGSALRPFAAGPNRFIAFPLHYLRSGRHEVRARARSLGGNASREAVTRFEVELQPQVLEVTVEPDVPAPPYPQKVTALVLDGYGNAVRDSTPVDFSCQGKQATVPTLDGLASIHAGSDLPFGCGPIQVSCAGLRHEVRLRSGAGGDYISGFVLGANGNSVKGVTVASTSNHALGFTDQDGYFLIPGKPLPESLAVSKPGFIQALVEVPKQTYPTVKLERFYPAIQAGTMIGLDADRGGSETGWIGPTGITGADLNLAVVETLADLLASVGIGTALTRQEDIEVSAQERVRRCEQHDLALVVSVAHLEADAPGVLMSHYPGSKGGIRLSKLLAQEAGPAASDMLASGQIRITETAAYLIQQTSCPAVKVAFASPVTLETESRISSPAEVWGRAYTIFYAIVRYLGISRETTFAITGHVTVQDGSPSNTIVTVDGTLRVLVDDRGNFHIKLLEPATHTIRASTATSQTHILTFDQPTGDIEMHLH
jgi:N-acetylmuramoyl-L-alanine amidase